MVLLVFLRRKETKAQTLSINIIQVWSKQDEGRHNPIEELIYRCNEDLQIYL